MKHMITKEFVDLSLCKAVLQSFWMLRSSPYIYTYTHAHTQTHTYKPILKKPKHLNASESFMPNDCVERRQCLIFCSWIFQTSHFTSDTILLLFKNIFRSTRGQLHRLFSRKKYKLSHERPWVYRPCSRKLAILGREGRPSSYPEEATLAVSITQNLYFAHGLASAPLYNSLWGHQYGQTNLVLYYQSFLDRVWTSFPHIFLL